MSENILKNVTKKDLLKLKKSKPVPITAHSFEVIVPVAYTSMVNNFLKKKGIKLPLSRDKLAKLRKIAQKTDGELSESDTDEGESYAKGTANLKTTAKAQNISKININIDTQKLRRRRRTKRKTKLKTVSGLIEPPKQESLLKAIKNPNINVLRPNDTFSLIRPITYSASTPVTDYKTTLDESVKKEKEAIKKREEELEKEKEKNREKMDKLEKSIEAERKRTEAILSNLLSFKLPPPTPYTPPQPKKKEEEEREQEDEQTSNVGSSAELSKGPAKPAVSIPDFLSKTFLTKIFNLIPFDERPIIVGGKTQISLYDAINDYNQEIIKTLKEEYEKLSKAGQNKKTHYQNGLIKIIQDKYFMEV